jgi:chemotaxis protein CheD
MTEILFESARDASDLPQVYLTPGTLFCSAVPAVVGTVLGSCVAVCLLDRHRRAAGMNHFVLSFDPAGGDSLRYGDVALARLRDRMARLGCDSHDLRAKVFGGAAVLPFGEQIDTVGSTNVRTALEWLQRQSIPVIARRTGGTNGMLLRFHTGLGRVLVRRIASGVDLSASSSVPSFDSNIDTQAWSGRPGRKDPP